MPNGMPFFLRCPKCTWFAHGPTQFPKQRGESHRNLLNFFWGWAVVAAVGQPVVLFP